MKLTWVMVFLAALATATLACPASATETVLPYDFYSNWGLPHQALYIHDIRESVVRFERESRADLALLDSSRSTANDLLAGLLLPNALADSLQYCPIGGGERALVSNGGGNMICPTTGRSCGAYSDGGFTCFAVFANSCVARLPVATLTQRCDEASRGTTILPRSTYNQMSNDLNTISNHCRSANYPARFQDACTRFSARLRTLGLENASNPTVVVSHPATTTSAPACFPNTTVKINYDEGGYSDQYLARARSYNRQGTGVQILGPCISACVDMIANMPKDHVCIGPRASLGFHYASYDNAHGETVAYNYTEHLAQSYIPELRAYWERVKGVGTPLSVKLLKGRELQSIYPSCASRTAAPCDRLPAGQVQAEAATNEPTAAAR